MEQGTHFHRGPDARVGNPFAVLAALEVEIGPGHERADDAAASPSRRPRLAGCTLQQSLGIRAASRARLYFPVPWRSGPRPGPAGCVARRPTPFAAAYAGQ